jgi:hypothetical protein
MQKQVVAHLTNLHTWHQRFCNNPALERIKPSALTPLGGRRHALPSSKIADSEPSTRDGFRASQKNHFQSLSKAPELEER